MTLILLYIPIGLVIYNVDGIMGRLDADAESLRYAVSYARTIMLGQFLTSVYDLEKKYLMQFGNTLFPMIIQFVTLPLHWIFVATLYDKWGDSLFGIALSLTISLTINFLVLHTYLVFVTNEPYRFKWR